MNQGKERRANPRYPIELRLSYRVTDHLQAVLQGTGKTRDISTAGVAFTTRQRLPEGATVELKLDWPVKLSDTTGLKLRVIGLVVRSGANITAVRVVRREFCSSSIRTKTGTETELITASELDPPLPVSEKP